MKSFIQSVIDDFRYFLIGIFLLTLFMLPESLFLSIPLFVLIMLCYLKRILRMLNKKKILK